ncbi:glycerol-3-phosphate acyltransferase [Kushneria sinocarnis]|uniref:Glycerol-3-phosphate acyltransferase n=1 Tax=Kushneria sinocarnis TaxID=595502 RepID=A0A420WZE5_9GAMM|nr:glycerol-3-phosphate 1-O-acyltransferase PlsB [Kushneria sinocarnis]RKR06644.1 glycerol-3-phosphate acyltransferase [Kushneria sinocarnis]
MHLPLRLRRGAVRAATALLAPLIRFRSIDPLPESRAHEGSPVVYVLQGPALSDRLALRLLCRRHALPDPDRRIVLSGQRHGTLHGLYRDSRQKHYTRSLARLLEAAAHAPGEDIRLVPVTIFWGRMPEREAGGLWRLLTADGWTLGSRLRRLLAMACNARAVEARLDTPLALRAPLTRYVETGRDPVPRIQRLLRRSFHRTRRQAIGPDLSHRRTLVRRLIHRPNVTAAIDAAATEQQQPRRGIERRALRYGFEIASNMSPPVLRLLYRLLGRLWQQLYDGVRVYGMEEVESLAGSHELVYVPCHRSHIDYLLLSWLLYRHGLMAPHIAAGRNLDMPLIGPLLRRAGAFFMRRSFRGNRLYGAVFNEYLHQLLLAGHPVEYFIEGGRSRTGRMLPPKPGMLSMTVDSWQHHHRRALTFVPVYIGYEKVLESNAYMRELRTGHKRRESPLRLLRVLRHLRQPFGQVHVSFGQPLTLGAWLDDHSPDWRRQSAEQPEAWRRKVVPALGFELASRINAAAALNPVALVATALLGTSHRTIETTLLYRQLDTLVALQRHAPGGERVRLPQGEPQQWVEHCVGLGMIEQVEQSLGTLTTAPDERATLLTWYRNNILHLFAAHALVAFAFRNNERLETTALHELIAPAWPTLRQELFLGDSELDDTRLARLLEAFAGEGLLTHDGTTWQRPAAHTEARERLHLLGRIIQPTLERGFLLLSTLMRYPSGAFDRDTLAAQSRQLAERLTLLQGLNAPEYYDQRLFSGLLDSLTEQGWLWHDEHGHLHFDQHLTGALQRSRLLFDPALRHRLTQLTASATPNGTADS